VEQAEGVQEAAVLTAGIQEAAIHLEEDILEQGEVPSAVEEIARQAHQKVQVGGVQEDFLQVNPVSVPRKVNPVVEVFSAEETMLIKNPLSHRDKQSL